MSAMPCCAPRTALAVFRTDSARDSACDVLRAAGVVSVVPAADAHDDAHYDVIVTDWPESGDLGAYVSGLRRSSNTPVLLLTARESRADLDAARRAGVDAYVVAPVSAAMLKHRLARLPARH